MKIQSQREHKSLEDYTWKEGLLYFKGRLYNPNELQKQILKEAHETPLAAHLGYHKMFFSPKRTILLARNEEGYLGILQAMSNLSESQGKKSQDSWKAPTIGYSSDEVGVHQYGFHYCFIKSNRKF